MSQSKDKKKFVGGGGGNNSGSGSGGGGGGGGYGSPKHNNNRNNSNNKSPHQSHHSQQQHHNQQSSPHHNQQPFDSLTAMKDRTLFMSMSLVGQIVSVTLKNGDIYEGILHTTSTSSAGWGVALKMARKKDNNSRVITTLPLPLVIIEAKDFLQITATGVVLDHYRDSFMNRDQQSFITDTELSGFDGNLKERELTPWTPDPSVGESLDDFAANSEAKKPANWDQFETNEKLFGVRTTYEEEIYTTRLDRDSDFYKTNQSAAEKKALEIENEKSGNIHLLEERGFIEGADYDEEERYSSVVRKGLLPPTTSTPPTQNPTPSSSVYIPPSKRNNTNSGGNTPSTSSSATSPPIVDKKHQQTHQDKKQPQTTPNTATTTTTTTSTTATTNESPLSSSTSSTPSTPSTPKNITTTGSTNNTPTSGVTAATTNINSPLGDRESPTISKLRLHQSTIDQDVMGSPRENLSPRSVAYTRFRQTMNKSGSNISTAPVNGTGNGVGPNGTPLLSSAHNDQAPKSPVPTIVSDHGLVKALSLELATPTVPERVVNDFNNFKLKYNNVDRGSETQGLKSFSNSLVIKSKSRPGSPLIGSGSPRPTPTQLSLSGSSSTTTAITSTTSPTTASTTEEEKSKSTGEKKDEPADDKEKEKEKEKVEEKEKEKEKSDEKESSTSTGEKKDESSATVKTSITTTTTSSIKPLSKLKLNPNAKEFVPVVVNKPQVQSFKPTTESNTDSVIPINEIYYESMRKRQLQPESPDQVSLYWVDPIYPRYEEDPYAAYQMRAHHMVGHQPPPPPLTFNPSFYPQQGHPQLQPHHHMVPPPQLQQVPPGVNVHTMKPPGGLQPGGQPQGQPPTANKTMYQQQSGQQGGPMGGVQRGGHPPPQVGQPQFIQGIPPGNLVISPNGPPNQQFVFAPQGGHPPYAVPHPQYGGPMPPQGIPGGNKRFYPQGYPQGPPMIIPQQGQVSPNSPQQDSPSNRLGQQVPYPYMTHPPRGYHPNENQYH
ncbi:hypothetical protein RB653_007011 [Dictyostelium firmibasis]|uniref:Sm domain-containing protein n=1 Tax=Dictyostelium firmibasis TaxID=79012 RepID=A0AAN7TTW8_9MYCE